MLLLLQHHTLFSLPVLPFFFSSLVYPEWVVGDRTFPFNGVDSFAHNGQWALATEEAESCHCYWQLDVTTNCYLIPDKTITINVSLGGVARSSQLIQSLSLKNKKMLPLRPLGKSFFHLASCISTTAEISVYLPLTLQFLAVNNTYLLHSIRDDQEMVLGETMKITCMN